MSETRTYYPDGSLRRLIVDNRDKELQLGIEDLKRSIPNDVSRIDYKEFNAQNAETFAISRTREQLLNMLDTYSFVYDFVYYGNGIIDTIRIRTYDASAVLLSDRTLKHFQDAKAPEFI